MGKYDGPSFYKKDYPKVKPLKKNQFDNDYKKSMPQTVRTRDTIKQDAKAYMETPSERKAVKKKTFRRQYIPASLQNLEGWQRTKKNDRLVAKIEKRLKKTEGSYLLFADQLKEKEKPKVQKKRPHKTHKIKHQTKANAGLHRTLSKIIAEDQEAIENGKNNLDSLFSEDK
jgi:hypothetical protein